MMSTVTWAQQPQVSSLKDSAIARSSTPSPVLTGSAKLMKPYATGSKLRLAIGIKPPHLDAEEKLLKDLQDKNSPKFHKYLTPEQWNARFAPSEQDEQAVVDWATSHGLAITARYPNRLMVNVEGTVDSIQKAFNLTINNYEVNGATEFSNDRDPLIPAQLVNIIGSVDGLNSIQRMRPARAGAQGVRGPDYSPGPMRQVAKEFQRSATAPKPTKASKSAKAEGVGSQVTNGWYDPTDIYSSNSYDYTALQNQGHCCNPTHTSGTTPPETSIALATDGQYADSDMTGFFNQYPYLAGHYQPIWVGGTPYCCDDETTLDLQWSTATSNSFGSGYDTSMIYVYEAANGFGTFGTLFQQMLTDNKVRVVNISYGLAEFDGVSSSVMDTWHGIFNQMVGQGWTVVAASGDNGASTGCGDYIATIYPGSDPDIVSVGGTQLEHYSDGTFYSETTWTGDTYSGACSSNHGGTGGGCSAKFAAPGYQTASPACGSGSRSVPDIALNASSHTAQNFFFNGSLSGVAGTSIASPMVSGFMAQENAYLLAIGLGGAPIGQVNYPLYYEGQHPTYAAHYPYYDVTSGCNSNDNTNYWGLGSYCAYAGYDVVTGWGSFNALQLAWAISTYHLGDFGAPVVTFSGPTVSTSSDTWFNTDQTVSWTIADTGQYTPTGIAGFSQAWDAPISDASSEATPGQGNAFYSGPQFPNATSGYLQLSWAGQGCHYATVDAWDNTGISSGNKYYYWLCYDTVAPTVSAANSPSPNSHGWNNQSVSVTLSASDSGTGASGIKKTYYLVDSTACSSGSLGSCATYSGPISITASGTHYVGYFTQDVAGNFSAKSYDYVYVDKTAPVTSATLAGSTIGSSYSSAVKVILAASDSLSGVASTTYSFDGGSNVTYTAPLITGAPGSHTVKYFSTDNAGNVEATKTVSFLIVSPTATTLTLSPSGSAVFGSAVSLSAKVSPSLSGIPTGTVTFKNGSTVLGTKSLSGGVATLSTTALPVGTDSLTASYAATANYHSSTSTAVSEVVKFATTATLTSAPNPSTYGQGVAFTVKVTSPSGTPGGTVEFFHGGISLGTASVVGGKAVLTSSVLTVGVHPVNAEYSGTATYSAGPTGTIKQTVNKAATTTSLASSVNPSSAGQKVTFTATVGRSGSGSTPTGTVEFFHGGVSFGTATLSGGKAIMAISSLTSGTHPITATYSGSTSYNTSVAPTLKQTIK